jgi:hypothetical protein
MSAHNHALEATLASWPIVDPGTGNAIPNDQSGIVEITTTDAGETNTLAAPVRTGVILTLNCYETVAAGTDTRVVTVASAYDELGSTTITLTAAGGFVTLISVKTAASTFAWRVLAYDNVTGPSQTFATTTTTTANVTTLAHTTTDLAEHGAGAVGTGIAPNTNRYTRDGVIITDIKIDITGLKCKGDAQGDCIALTGAGYIGRNVVATNGIIYRIEMICLETPAGSATSTLDIDLMAEDDDDVAYDGPVDDTVIARAGSWAAGQVAITNVPALTANDYFYLGEGDTAATTGTYTAGMFLIRLYGHPVLA